MVNWVCFYRTFTVFFANKQDSQSHFSRQLIENFCQPLVKLQKYIYYTAQVFGPPISDRSKSQVFAQQGTPHLSFFTYGANSQIDTRDSVAAGSWQNVWLAGLHLQAILKDQHPRSLDYRHLPRSPAICDPKLDIFIMVKLSVLLLIGHLRYFFLFANKQDSRSLFKAFHWKFLSKPS